MGLGRVARVTSAPHDPDAEREVDLRSVWARIAARWWLPVLGTILGLAIGFALAAGVFIAGPISGGAVNPARALGPMLVSISLLMLMAVVFGKRLQRGPALTTAVDP